MRIIVTAKQVPDPEAPQSSFSVDSDAKKVVVAASVPQAVSDYDTYAAEAALRIKDEVDGTTVSILSLGEDHVLDVIKRPIAMGADELFLVQDEELANGDAMAIAHTLAAAIKNMGEFDLIMCGRQSADLDQGIVGTGLAAILGIPVLTSAVGVRLKDDWIEIDRAVEDGIDTVSAQLPAVVTVSSEIGEARYATMRGIMAARKVQPTIWSKDDLTSLEDSEAFTSVVDVFAPESESNVEMIEGDDAADSGRLLAQKLREERLI
jgi:electron transfer flavoprotein beta subunit